MTPFTPSSFQAVHISTLFLHWECLSHTHSLFQCYPCIKILCTSCILCDISPDRYKCGLDYFFHCLWLQWPYFLNHTHTIYDSVCSLIIDCCELLFNFSPVYLVRLCKLQMGTQYWMGKKFNQAIKLHFDYPLMRIIHMSLTCFGN